MDSNISELIEFNYVSWYWKECFYYRYTVMKQSLSFLFWHAFRGPDVASLRVKTLFQAM